MQSPNAFAQIEAFSMTPRPVHRLRSVAPDCYVPSAVQWQATMEHFQEHNHLHLQQQTGSPKFL